MKPSLFQLIFEWNALFFWSNIFPFWDSVFLGTLIFFSAVWAFHVYSSLSGCGMPYFFFGPTFFHFGTQYFWEYQKTLFSAVWAFHVYSCLSGCGMPYFFLVHHFSILGLCIFLTFLGYLKIIFFQLFGHFVSTLV